jgi:hypothetical protein
MCGGTDEEHTGPQRLTIESLTEDESNACWVWYNWFVELLPEQVCRRHWKTDPSYFLKQSSVNYIWKFNCVKNIPVSLHFCVI